MMNPLSRFFNFMDKKDDAEEKEIQEEQVEHVPHENEVDELQQDGSNDSRQDEVQEIPVGHIVPNRFQPRTIFIEDKIDELAQTIEEHGIIQPIVVRKVADQFEIIAGERRFRAVSKLGWETIPAIVKDMDDNQTASVALIENLQREELTAIEEAAAYAKLIELQNLTQEALAKRLGKTQSTVANKLRLLRLPEEIQQSLMKREVSERHARALLVLKDEALQLQVWQEILQKGYNVKQTEERIKQIQAPPKKEKKPMRKSVSRDVRLARNTIRESIQMVSQAGMNIQSEEEDHDDYYEIKIIIQKKK
ncbi:nucleoid occlusion protein [Massilibacterium senegalense]|uniref:nucleoid occlusion protein n=1 Tax=Massilibacterium senegalense TaxID=1632858 RepID=UPI000782703E|nr:nucleoid occlusion protein [Massilibacterium senegalense]